MKKGAERKNRIKTIREHLKEIGAMALANEIEASRSRDYATALIHTQYVAAIEKAVGVCDGFLRFGEELK